MYNVIPVLIIIILAACYFSAQSWIIPLVQKLSPKKEPWNLKGIWTFDGFKKQAECWLISYHMEINWKGLDYWGNIHQRAS